MRTPPRLFLPTTAVLALCSCASVPTGGPTRYGLDRAAQAAAAGEAAQDAEELRFGLLCTGYFCSERYQVSGASFIPLVGGAYPDKPSTPKLFSKQRPYRNLAWLTSSSEAQDSDVIVKFNLDKFESVIRVDVVSAYTRRSLYQAQCKRCLPGIGAAVYDAFKPGQPLYKAVAAERAAALKRLEAPAASGISKEDIATIVQAVSGAQAAAKAAAPAALVSDVDQPGYSAPERPEDFALVIGIEKYSDLPPAAFAERDSQAVAAHLQALGVPRRNIIHLTGEKAGRAGIEKYLERWLPRNVGDNGRVFFYFSGHGAPDLKTGEPYLVPWDGDADFLETTGYPVKRLYEMLGALKARQVVAVLDSCFSGGGGRSVLAKGARPLVTKLETAAPASPKVTAFSASAASEISNSLEDQGHGAFTYYFLKGLGGAAQDPSGRVTAQGLYDYLVPKVQEAARRRNRDQTPQLLCAGGSGSELILR